MMMGGYKLGDWIDKLGFWGYMRQFPVNPITIVGCAVIAGVIVLFISASAKKRKASQFLLKNPGAAVMTFHKKQTGNPSYADNIRITKLNGETAPWFFIRPMIPALYLKPGENHIELHSDWARGGGVAIKMFKSDPVVLTVTAEQKGHYSLEYAIAENKYIFEPFRLPE
jgi:hypothetical protein